MQAKRYTSLQPDLFRRCPTVRLETEQRSAAIAALAQLMTVVVGIGKEEREDACDDGC